MSDIVTTIFSSFTSVITSLTSGLKSAFSNLIYEDPTAATPELSGLATFGFILLGIGIATGIAYGIFRLIKNH